MSGRSREARPGRWPRGHSPPAEVSLWNKDQQQQNIKLYNLELEKNPKKHPQLEITRRGITAPPADKVQLNYLKCTKKNKTKTTKKKNSTAKQLFCAFWLYQNWTTLLLHTSHILVTPFRNDCLSLGSLLKWAVAHKKGNTALWEKMQTQTIGNNWPVYPNATTLRNMGQSKWIFRKEKKRSMEQTESHEKSTPLPIV